MTQTVIRPTTLEALAGLALEDGVRCERIVVDERIEMIAIVAQVQFGRTLVQVQSLIVLPGDEAGDLRFRPVASDLEVAFQSCAASF